MAVETWDEIRTAYQVARLGTVSGAAEVLGVHHATVIRHVDTLETRLGVKLFQRHARGYTPTEAGQDLFRVAQATDDQLTQLSSRIRGQGHAMSGELVVTALPRLAYFLVPALVGFQSEHPDLVVRFLSAERIFRLEYGEAHIAVRAGTQPTQPDNVVQPFLRDALALYASEGYVARYGAPASDAAEALATHRFVSHDDGEIRAPFFRWLRANVPPEAIVFRATESEALEAAVACGAGIGFIPVREAAAIPGLVQVLPPRDEWTVQLWLVTHVDLHRTAKVQAFLKYLKDSVKDAPG